VRESRLGAVARLVHRLAGAILMAYPPGFRRALGADLLDAFGDRLEDASRRRPPVALLLMARALLDLAWSAVLEWIGPSYRGGPGVSGASGRSATPGAPPPRGLSMDHLAQDIRFAVRSLMRRPGFALVAVVTLALGIGATTAVFSVIRGVLLEPLPYPDASRLVMVWASDADGALTRGSMSQPDIESARGTKGLQGLEGVSQSRFILTGVDHPEEVTAARVSGGIFSIFGLAPTLGRDLREAENGTGAARVVVVGYHFWKSRLGGRPDVVGTTIELSERRYEIVGVGPEGFDFPNHAEMWTPYRLDVEGCGRGCHVYRGAVGRLAPGVDLRQAQEALTALSTALSQEFRDSNYGVALRFERLIDYEVGDVRGGLWIVLGAVSLVLLIVCANLANLLLVRSSTRGGEVAVRAALGASRGRLVRQVLTESLVLAGVGGGVGIGLAYGLVSALKQVARGAVPRLDQVAVNAPVLIFALGLSLLVALVFGLSPALRLARGSVSGGLSAAGRSGDARREGRARSILLAGEVALSLALLVGAGLLMRSLGRLYGVDRGYDGREVTRFQVSLPSSRYDSLPAITSFFGRLEGELRSIPGVEAVGSSFGPPLTRSAITGGVRVDGRPEPKPEEETEAAVRSVTPGYFDAMGLILLRGRPLAASDRLGTEPVAVANEAFVRENFPGQDVLGKRVRVTVSFGYGSPTWTVVGVVHDVRRTLDRAPTPALYVPVAQFGPGSLTVAMKIRAGAGAGVVAAARQTLRAMDPNVIPTNVETVTQALRAATAPTRFYLMLVGIFAALAVVLAAIGLYGVVAYLVSRRTREIGVRIALGARRGEISGLVFRQAALPTVGGVVVGLGVALAGGRIMKSLLFEVQPGDPLVFGSVTALILGVCVLAVLLPARRAMRVDPVCALRSE